MSKNKPNILMTNEACESKQRSVVRSSMHPYPENRVAVRRAVVYYAWAARAFSAGIKCLHCISLTAVILFDSFVLLTLYHKVMVRFVASIPMLPEDGNTHDTCDCVLFTNMRKHLLTVIVTAG